MKPRPIRMPDSLWEELSEEAEESDLGTAEYVRRILRNRQEITLEDTQPGREELAERVAELEERVESLESKRVEGGSEPVRGRGRVDESGFAGGSGTSEPIDQAVESWSPGVAGEDREQRRNALREALEFLAETGSARKGDFQEYLYPETALESQNSVSGWWEGMVQPGLNHAREEGIVELAGHTWEWRGD